MKKIFFIAICAALAACSPVPAPPPVPPSPAPTIVAATATNVPPTATIAPTVTSTRAPTNTPVPPTITLTPTVARASNETPPTSIVVILSPAPNLATATFTLRGSRTQVDVALTPSAPNIAQTAVIYERTCSQPGITRFALNNVVNGKSSTVVDASFAILLSGVMSLDVKKSTQPGEASAACRLIPEAYVIPLDQGIQPGVAVAFDQLGGTELDVFIKPGPPGESQPGFIRDGACPFLGGIRYTLEPTVDGVSKTFFGVAASQFKKERAALNIHKSVWELETAAACGNFPRPE